VLNSVEVLIHCFWVKKITAQLDHAGNSRAFVQYISLRQTQLIKTFTEMSVGFRVEG
jgi:hypothetical protein